MKSFKKTLLVCLLLIPIAPVLAALEDVPATDNTPKLSKQSPKHSFEKKKSKKKKRRLKKKSTVSKGDSGPQEEVTDQREVSQQADKSGQDTKHKKY